MCSRQGIASACSTSSRGARDVLLAQARAIAALPPSGQGGNICGGSVVVTIPPGLAAGSYRVLACADDLKVVPEVSESNNCFASFGAVQVTR